MKMLSAKKIGFAQANKGNVTIELAFILPAIFLLFAISWQTGRYFYWQLHLDQMTDRLVKLVALDIQQQTSFNAQQLDDTLLLVQELPRNIDFEFGIQGFILSDRTHREVDFSIGIACNNPNAYAQNISDLPSIDILVNGAPVERSLLRLTLCAEPNEWPMLIPGFLDTKDPISSTSFYPINSVALP